ncbi:MAG TPA: hypothetical protein PKI02_15540, partial [Mycobacterium sp.]|nr:hypothetical protein [Mycobacterium sp.]
MAPPDIPAQYLLAERAPAPRTLVDILYDTAARYPDAAAIDDGTVQLTYAELIADVEDSVEWLAARGIDHGVVFVSLRGQRVVRYPELGMVGMMCVPDLARGSAWALLDPRPEAGLRIRGLPDSAPLIQDWLVRYAPGQPAWLLAQDLGVGVWTLAPIDLTSGDA